MYMQQEEYGLGLEVMPTQTQEKVNFHSQLNLDYQRTPSWDPSGKT